MRKCKIELQAIKIILPLFLFVLLTKTIYSVILPCSLSNRVAKYETRRMQ